MKKKITSLFSQFNLINILGLSTGIACVLAIMLWVNDELGYDTFHKNSDKIYRVLVEENDMDGYSNCAMTARPLASALNEMLPQIDNAANFEMDWNIVTHVADNYYKEEGLAVVGKDFFNIFSFPFTCGSPQLLSQDKYVVVISEKVAQKYFGKEDAVGKDFELEGENVTVAGVFKNINYNSHIKFDIAINEKLGNAIFHSHKEWNSQNLYTYIRIAPNVSNKELSKAIYSFIPDNINSKFDYKLLLQPLNEIHFQKGLSDEDYTYLGNEIYVYIFSFMGLFILILACVNYINLSTAVSEKRIKENKVRKILGASKIAIIKTSLLKSYYTSFLATLIAVLLIYLLLPFINTFTQKHLNIDFTRPVYFLVILAIPIIVGLLSGIYPALHFASYSLNLTKKVRASFANWQRNALVVLQFTLSVGLIIATLVSHEQLKKQRNLDLGFNKEQTAYFNIDFGASGYKTLKENLQNIPGVEMVAGKNYFSSTTLNTTKVKWTGIEKGVPFSSNRVDENFFPLLQVDFIAGNNFQKDLKSDLKQSIIINKKAKELIGLSNPVGMKLFTMGKVFTVIGVIDNVHFRSINETVQPEFYAYADNPGNIFIRFGNNSLISNYEIIDKVNSTIKRLYPEQPFELEFLDATYARLYNHDKRVSTIFSTIAFIAIFISCIGLFGLSSFNTDRRIKEIGIRKVNGAKISEVLMMLNKDFVTWVVIAFAIACPIAWYSMAKWLENFAYKTELSWWIFALAGAIALVIALFTVSWQSWKAATRNPVEALRYE